MREDYAIAADLCEEHGLVAPAQVLRDVANWVFEVYMVRPNAAEIQSQEVAGSTVAATSRLRCLFTSRDAAERHSAHLKAIMLRELPYQLGPWGHPLAVSEEEFCRRVGDILRADYRLPGPDPAPLIPPWASDEQSAAIALLVRREFFEVVGVLLDFEGEA